MARLDGASRSLPATTSVESGLGPDEQTRAIHFGEKRGFLSGTLGKKMGLRVESSQQEDKERVYRILSK